MKKNSRISHKISRMAISAVVLALLVTFGFNAVYTVTSRQHQAIVELKTLARITALNSQSALLFNDAETSDETLSALAPRLDIVSAEMITASGDPLSVRHFNHGEDETRLQWLAGLLPDAAVVQVEEPVTLNGKTLGKIKLSADLMPVWLTTFYTLLVYIGAMLLALALSIFMMRRLIPHIMTPIERLGESARNIARTRQFALRVEKLTDDELGTLTDQFNKMLDELEKQDRELLNRNESLEQEVQSRTSAMRAAMDEMYTLLNSMAEGAFGVDTRGNCRFVNASFLRLLGYDRVEEIIGKNMHGLIQATRPDGTVYPESDSKIINAYREKRGFHASDEVFWRKDGVPISVEFWAQPLIVEGEVQGVIATFVDITERIRAENELKIAATAFESQEGMLVTDADNRILRVNRAFTSITGYEKEEVIGQNPRLLSSGLHDQAFYEGMWAALNGSGTWEGEIWNRKKDGSIYAELLSITAVKDHHNVVTNYVGTFNDITMNKAAEEQIRNLAFYDPLSGLPNRRLLLDRLHQALASSARSGKQGAVLFLDLDHFKTLNDTQGHDMGDLLLQEVAKRLTGSVREDDTVARFGGDEFVVVLEDLSENTLEAAAQTEVIGEKILSTINKPYVLRDREYHSTSSIGATLFNDHQSGVEELLKQADIAMYQAKTSGRNTVRFFDPKMQETINVRATLEAELRTALEQEQFRLYYQVQVDKYGAALGAEALIRWTHPTRGMVSPVHFIPLAEETGLITQIGQWVLETACAQIKAWQLRPETRNLVLSINVSAKQFRENDFVSNVRSAVARFGIDPRRLKLELTESLLHENVDNTVLIMNALRDVGVRFSLDDFGTGYSSLQYLKRLPLDQLKIDQSFVRDLVIDSSDRSIVRTIVAMAQSLNLDVIAEGVETEAQRDILLSNACVQYQGYLFGKPLPIEQFEARFAQVA